MANAKGRAMADHNSRVQYRCSFCGKRQEQVLRLIAGPGGVYICNECVDLCQEIIGEEVTGAPQSIQAETRTGGTCLLCDRPITDTTQWGISVSPSGADQDWRLLHRLHEACLRRALPADSIVWVAVTDGDSD